MGKGNELDTNESHTWLILVALLLTGFFYQWNVIYSTTTIPSCHTYHLYWLYNAGSGTPLHLTALTFILVGIWSLIEFLLACFKQVSDRLFAIILNILIIASVGFSLYSLYKLEQTIKVHPYLYSQQLDSEYTGKPIAFYQESNCVSHEISE